MDETCKTCEFWAAYGEPDSAKGECGMITEHETRVTVVPMFRRKNAGEAFRGIEVHDKDFPAGIEFSAVLVTPPDFGCDSWQERVTGLQDAAE